MNLPDSKEARASRLARLALFVWLAPLKVGLNMFSFATDKYGRTVNMCHIENECGTSCCFIGHAPLILDIKKFNLHKNDWTYLSRKFLYSDEEKHDEWLFLFSPANENHRKLAAYRAYLYLSKDSIPFCQTKRRYQCFMEDRSKLNQSTMSNTYKDFMDKNLKEALMSYLIPDDGTNGWVPGDPIS